MKTISEIIYGDILSNNDNLISEITDNSKNVRSNSLFFAIKGTSTDGHNFVEEAIYKGAVGVVVQDRDMAISLKDRFKDITVVYSENTRKSLAMTANNFFDKPSESLKVIGITGTNGKTSVSNILQQFYRFAGFKTGIIGTINYRVDDEVISEGQTTPDPINWFKTLNKMKQKGAQVIVAEVSSHALDQYRIYGTKFDGAIFTNLTQDHLDYHKEMIDYFLAKEKLFDFTLKFNKNPKSSVNFDDVYGRKIYEMYKDSFNMISFGKTSPDFRIDNISLSITQTEFEYTYKNKRKKVISKLLGEFNVYNLSAAISYLILDNFDENFLIEKSLQINPVRGRFEVISKGNITAVIDYAHTPDGLEKILKSINKIRKGRIITVFGAGGDRDKGKRPIMGSIAENFSDIVIITSDNPRYEDPLKIIDDILSGIKDRTKILVIKDREEAIRKAIQIAKANDVILVAGKGHETYQIVKGEKKYFDDLQVIKKYLESGDENV